LKGHGCRVLRSGFPYGNLDFTTSLPTFWAAGAVRAYRHCKSVDDIKMDFDSAGACQFHKKKVLPADKVATEREIAVCNKLPSGL